MKFVLAPDSFKESMTAKEVADSMERGIKKVYADAECIKVPMADGGEGTVQSLIDATSGKLINVNVIGPLGNKVQSSFGLSGDGKTAIIEMASASGLHLVKKCDRNPLITTTYGTGMLIKEALDKRVNNILIGIGGSATNDGGAGMLQALGGKLLDIDGREISFGGGSLNLLHSIDLSSLDKRLKNVKIQVACDVTNPLIGENGASKVFGPQKGASSKMVEILDKNLTHYANVIKKTLGKDIANVSGAGAAGGFGAGIMAFLGGELKSGIELVIKFTQLEKKMKDADFVFTGEGSIDSQTVCGKTPYGVAITAKKLNIPVIAFAGQVGEDVSALYKHGINSIIGILLEAMDLTTALKQGSVNMERAVENVCRILDIEKRV